MHRGVFFKLLSFSLVDPLLLMDLPLLVDLLLLVDFPSLASGGLSLSRWC